MPRTPVHTSFLTASAAVAVLALLAASTALAAPAPEDKEEAVAAAEALLHEADWDTTQHGRDRNKRQTTTVCMQVNPGRPGHAPAVVCGNPEEVEKKMRRMALQTSTPTPQSVAASDDNNTVVIQAQPARQREAEQPALQPGAAGSPAAQQQLLQQLREAQEDVLRARAASLPRKVVADLTRVSPQVGDLLQLQEELATLQHREKTLRETIQAFRAAGQEDRGAAIVGLQAAVEQVAETRAAVEQAILLKHAEAQAAELAALRQERAALRRREGRLKEATKSIKAVAEQTVVGLKATAERIAKDLAAIEEPRPAGAGEVPFMW